MHKFSSIFQNRWYTPHLMKKIVAVVGLGYVGLPLAHALAKNGHETIGFDINQKRIDELNSGHDHTNELTDKQLTEITMEFSADPTVLKKADIVVVAVPTPIDDQKNPDLRILESASKTVGENLKEGAIVCFESTVYPGTTEEICGPIIEKASGLKQSEQFKLGYSPERINPGDKKHTIDKILKIVAGEDEETLNELSKMYGSFVTVGIHKAPNIKVAEMGKAIENAQRDLNIAFVNEIAMLCHKIGISTTDVLEAAGTKWNFLRFQPGLVGGHCIGVDPYYLVEKARQLGMTIQVITAGRGVNDGMSKLIADEVVEKINGDANDARVLVLGLTFKENVPDRRNSKASEVVEELIKAGCTVEVHDAELEDSEIESMGFTLGSLENGPYDAVLLLVQHKEYKDADTSVYLNATKDDGVIYDLKSILDRDAIEKSGRTYMAL